jgi:UDP-N-acetylglucosamine:LPS N-acetylglucosamine transferase
MPTILLMMSDTGGGHRAVCRALVEAFQAIDPAIDAPVVDLFALGKRRLIVDRLTQSYGPLIRRAPWLYGLAYRATNRSSLFEALSKANDGVLVQRGRWLLRRHQPDVVVSVHALVTRPMLKALRAEGGRQPIVVVVPDLVRFHRSWVAKGVHCYTAPTPEGANLLVEYGAPRDRVSLTGLPVGRAFATPSDPAHLRARLGLDPRRLTVLVVGGGEGGGDLPTLVDAIDQAGLPIQLIVVTGRNQRAKAAIEALPLFTPAKIFGFATNMPDLIKASDIVVSKGGPQSIVECLVAGKPILVTQVLPGQEEGNDEWVERHGAGYRTRTPTQVAQALRKLTRQPAELARLTEGARRLGQPDAADRVARVVLGALGR